MFKTRLLSGIVLVILAIILIVTGGDVLLFPLILFHASECLNCTGYLKLKNHCWHILVMQRFWYFIAV